MSQQNVNDWSDKFGIRLDIGQTIAAVRGKALHVGDILWFTPKGVTIESVSSNGDTEKVSIGFYNNKKEKGSVVILK